MPTRGAIRWSMAAVGVGAVVLWNRQTGDALLRADSFVDAVATVAFWALPTLVLYVVLARSAVEVAVEGVLLVIGSALVWWSAATDWHSTASVGPGLCGWFVGPVVVIAARGIGDLAASRRRRARAASSVRQPVTRA